MAVTINTLNAGNMTVTLQSSANVVFTFTDDSTQEFTLNGTLDQAWLVENGLCTNDMSIQWVKQPLTVVIGAGVTGIGDDAFYECSSLTSVDMSESDVTIIGERAFADTTSGEIHIPSSISLIKTDAFRGHSIPMGSPDDYHNIIFYGKTLSQVQSMTNYSWGTIYTNCFGVSNS